MKGQGSMTGVLEQDLEWDSSPCKHVYSTVFQKQKQKPYFLNKCNNQSISLSHTNLLSCFITHQIQQMHQQRGPQLPWKDRLLGRAQRHLGHHRQNSRNTNTTQNTESQHTNGHMDVTKKRWASRWNGREQKKMRGQRQENSENTRNMQPSDCRGFKSTQLSKNSKTLSKELCERAA